MTQETEEILFKIRAIQCVIPTTDKPISYNKNENLSLDYRLSENVYKIFKFNLLILFQHCTPYFLPVE